MATGLPGERAGVWKIVFQNMIIQRAGPLGSANTQGLTSSYILYGTPTQAEELAYFFSSGTYKLVLKSQQDSNPGDTLSPGTTSGADQNSFNSKYNVR